MWINLQDNVDDCTVCNCNAHPEAASSWPSQNYAYKIKTCTTTGPHDINNCLLFQDLTHSNWAPKLNLVSYKHCYISDRRLCLLSKLFTAWSLLKSYCRSFQGFTGFFEMWTPSIIITRSRIRSNRGFGENLVTNGTDGNRFSNVPFDGRVLDSKGVQIEKEFFSGTLSIMNGVHWFLHQISRSV